MRAQWAISLGLLVSLLGTAPAVAESRQVDLRVMNYNIHYALAQDGTASDLNRIIAEIKAERPDVVTLQEVHINSIESGRVNQVTRLASALGMYYYFGDNDTSGVPGSQQSPFVGSHGNLVLSRFPIVERVTYHLPRSSQDSPARVTRGMTGVRLDVNGTPVRVYTTHLTNGVGPVSKESRRLQVNDILRRIGHVGGRVLLTGDLNMVDNEPPVQKLVTHGFRDTAANAGPTSPQREPTVRIDYVFSKSLRASRAHVPVGGASDHRAVVVDMTG